MSNKWKVINPYSGQTVAEVPLHTVSEGIEMLRKAKHVFSELKSVPRHERARALHQVADALHQNKEEIAAIMREEAGKPIRLARVELERAIFTFTYAAEEAKRFGISAIPMDLVPGSEHRFGIIERFPVGPIVGITPFNFPLNLVAHKVAPALAVGNPIIIKPNIQTPLCALKLKELIDQTSLPKDAMQVALLPGPEAEALIRDDACKMVSFTGSAAVGWHIKQVAAQKKVVLELGGNAVAILAQDGNAERFARKVVPAAFGYAGQSCISVQTALIHHTHYSEVRDHIVRATMQLAVGDPANPDVWCGPVINNTAADRIMGWIAEAKGATVLCGNTRKGLMIAPTVLEDVPLDAKVSCEEVFGPVLIVRAFSEDHQAVDFVNASQYGLQCGVFTESFSRMRYYFTHLEVGGVMINEMPTYRVDHMPYGGVKNSGFGREGIIWTMEEMTEPRLMMVAPSA